MATLKPWLFSVGRLVDDFIYEKPGRLLRIYRTVKDDKQMYVQISPEEGISNAVPIKVITYRKCLRSEFQRHHPPQIRSACAACIQSQPTQADLMRGRRVNDGCAYNYTLNYLYFRAFKTYLTSYHHLLQYIRPFMMKVW